MKSNRLIGMILEIFYEDENLIDPIEKRIKEIYGLDVDRRGFMRVIRSAYNSSRDQYEASYLLSFLIRRKKREIALWIVKEDLYCDGMNFVFGLASYRKGAILSTFRLFTTELVEKEAVHEVGHVLGLKHCKNRCVMHFSNSLLEAMEKPCELCESCKMLIDKIGAD